METVIGQRVKPANGQLRQMLRIMIVWNSGYARRNQRNLEKSWIFIDPEARAAS
jgi:hypothetical protein